MSEVEDGWDDDDGFFGSDDDEDVSGAGGDSRGDALPQQPTSSLPPTGAAGPPIFPASNLSDHSAGGGWAEDDDALDFDDDDDQPVNTGRPAPPPPPSPPPPMQSDSNVDAYPMTRQTFLSSLASASSTDDRLYRDLEAYILSLDRISSSINAVLEAEYNNDSHEKAMEIVQYYLERPGLVSYTVEKELSRMEYVVTLPPSSRGLPPTTISDKKQIAQVLKQQELTQKPSLLARCSNQSILADLLQVCTGHDRLVRPQFMASAVAQECRFHLDFVAERLQVEAHLSLSIPTTSGRWEVARIVASVEFFPREHEPSVRYRLDSVHVVSSPKTDPTFQNRARSAIEILREGLLDHVPEDYTPSDATGLNFRDVFLQQSQNILVQSADGMQSAWKEFEQVAGIKSKLMNLPTFLPGDVLNAAEQETFTLQSQQQEQRMQRDEAPQRPKSILGGLVRSGFKKLAQQVALPTEDPSIYEHWSSQAAQTPTRPREATTPRRDPHTPPLLLHNKFESPSAVISNHRVPPHVEQSRKYVPILNQAGIGNRTPILDGQASAFGPRLSAPDTQLATVPMQRSIAPNPSLQDGWGDEEDDLFESEEQADDATSPQKSPDVSVSAAEKPLTSAAPADERCRYLVDESKQVPAGWIYDPTTGIIPTRKRWTSPYQNYRFD